MAKRYYVLSEVHDMLMKKRLEAFNEAGRFDYAQFPDSSGSQSGEVLFLLLRYYFEEYEEYENCEEVRNLRDEYRAKFGTKELTEAEFDKEIGGQDF